MSIYGTIFRVATFGESHGAAVGCVIDGCPPGLNVNVHEIQAQLDRRRPGLSVLTTARNEKDQVQILSGTERNVSLGTPIALIVPNEDVKKFDYANTLEIPRPGHADYTYQVKYGVTASSGGGRASARETISRVAAGAIAEKYLREKFGTEIVCWVESIFNVVIPKDLRRNFQVQPPTREQVDRMGGVWKEDEDVLLDWEGNRYLLKTGDKIPGLAEVEGKQMIACMRCPHGPTAVKMAALVMSTKQEGDSLGGVVSCAVRSVPVGLGEPCFDKLEAELAKAMMSLPATKAFEIGEGFAACMMKGSEHNDAFKYMSGSRCLVTESNHSGGTLGGISNGMPIYFRVGFKPVSSINKTQQTCNYNGEMDELQVKGRHDPCVLPRTPALIEGMTALVIIDMVLRQQARRSGNLVVVR